MNEDCAARSSALTDSRRRQTEMSRETQNRKPFTILINPFIEVDRFGIAFALGNIIMMKAALIRAATTRTSPRTSTGINEITSNRGRHTESDIERRAEDTQ